MFLKNSFSSLNLPIFHPEEEAPLLSPWTKERVLSNFFDDLG
jgi:hypothetical protein